MREAVGRLAGHSPFGCRWALGALLVILVAAMVERGVAEWRTRRSFPPRGASWIWDAEAARQGHAVAFYAVRDFRLEAVPKAAFLSVLADEEYVLFLNAKRIGSNRYSSRAAVDRYDALPWLRHGGNRLVVELRSARGGGGLVACLELSEQGGCEVTTDGAWTTFREHRPGVVRAWLPAAHGEPALVWGRAPTGRWGALERGPLRPAFETCGSADPLPGFSLSESGRPDDAAFLLDWGGEVAGYLDLEVAGAPRRGSLWSASVLEEVLQRLPEAEEAVILMPHQRRWRAPLPRRFRYVLVEGLEEVGGVRVYPIRPDCESRLAGKTAVVGALLGLSPPVGLGSRVHPAVRVPSETDPSLE